jgi:OOP family OmpA-OmpF porin
LWWVVLIAWTAGSTYWHVCKIKALCDQDFIPSSGAALGPSPTVLVISDSNALELHSKGDFAFAKNGVVANQSAVAPEMDSLAAYLSANHHKLLTITGHYSPEEKNTTIFPDLGLARADGIKNWLISKGLPDSLINLNSQKKDIAFRNDSLTGGISFDIDNKILQEVNTAVTETDLANQQKYDNIFKPLDLYFPTASTDYIKTDQNSLFISEAKKFLAENQDKKLLLTGHTDDEDSAEWNLTLSLKRANAVKKQFIAMGIAPDRILTAGKGESEPKASNAVPEGKRANRRVTIVVK